MLRIVFHMTNNLLEMIYNRRFCKTALLNFAINNMESSFYNNRRQSSEESDPETLQKNFNRFVESYNNDFIFFLRRAASGHYNCLVTSGRILKDLHDFVVFMQSATGMQFEIVPHPFTFRHGREYYRLLGFDDEEINNIHGFFDYVNKTFGKEFEQCMQEDTKFLCAKV